MKHFFAVDEFEQLDHFAFRTETNNKVIEIFLRELIRHKKSIGNRHSAEGNEGFNFVVTYLALIHKRVLNY
jgi:hypothetical protein